jgi:hypothetical protein
VIAIAQQVVAIGRAKVGRVEFEAADQVKRQRGRQPHLAGDHAKRVESRLAGRLTGQRRQSENAYPGDPGGGITLRRHAMAEQLPVGNVVAGTAPCIEQPRAFARRPVEQPARQREGTRTARDPALSFRYQFRAIQAQIPHDDIGRQLRRRHRFAAASSAGQAR